MSYTLDPIFDDNTGVGVGYVLHLVTPSQPLSETDAQHLFVECAMSVAEQEDLGRGICGIAVVLRSAEGLAPQQPQQPSSSEQDNKFLTAMCTFIATHPFARARRRPGLLPPHLNVVATLSEDDDEGDNESDKIFEEATSRICDAFWRNEQLYYVYYVAMNVPFVPSQAVVDHMLITAAEVSRVLNYEDDDEDPHGLPSIPRSPYQFTLCARDRRATIGGAEPLDDILQVDEEGIASLSAVGVNYVSAVLDRAFNVHRPGAGAGAIPGPAIAIASNRVADAVAACLLLREHDTTTCLSSLNLAAGKWSNIAAMGAYDDFEPCLLDGKRLFHAALANPVVTHLTLSNFELTGDLSGINDVQEPDAPIAAPLRSLTLNDCEFPDDDDNDDPVRGAGALVTTILSRCRSLESLRLCGTRLSRQDTVALCRALLAGSNDIDNEGGGASITDLELGSYRLSVENWFLDDESVTHFFRVLPALKSLRTFKFHHRVPLCLHRTVVDGVKDNYWLQTFEGVWFDNRDDANDERAAVPSVKDGTGPVAPIHPGGEIRGGIARLQVGPCDYHHRPSTTVGSEQCWRSASSAGATCQLGRRRLERLHNSVPVRAHVPADCRGWWWRKSRTWWSRNRTKKLTSRR